jgi:sorbitol-specific phosphotransferase system component IIA
MTTLTAIAIITLVGVLFAAMAVAPMVIEIGETRPKRSTSLTLVHSTTTEPDQLHAA